MSFIKQRKITQSLYHVGHFCKQEKQLNFSDGTLSPETKLSAELPRILKFLNTLESFRNVLLNQSFLSVS